MTWYVGYIGMYLIFMFAMGIYYFRRVKTHDSYNIAGWSVGFWPIVGTVISTCCGAAVFIGWVGMGYTAGLSGYLKFAAPAYVVSILLVYFFAGPLRRQKLFTLADLFGQRYGKEAGIVPSILSAFIYSVPTTALQLVGMSTVFNICFNIPFTQGIVLGMILVTAFTVLGGLPATIITDAIQSIILLIGIMLLLFSGITYGGGITDIIANTPVEYFSAAGPDGYMAVFLFAFSVGPFYLVWQSTWQRMFAAKDERVARNACLTGFVLVGVISLVPYLIGIIARQFVPVDIRPDLIFSYVTAEMMPPYLGGIVFVGLLAALMTGATSFIMQGSSNLVMDFYQRLINPGAREKTMMLVSRLAVIIVAVLAMLVALNTTGIIALYQWALRLSATILVLPFLATMFWKRTTKTAIIISMLVSFLATISWPFLNIGIDHTAFGFLASFISLVGISLMTGHSASEEVVAVYYDNLSSANRTRAEAD